MYFWTQNPNSTFVLPIKGRKFCYLGFLEKFRWFGGILRLDAGVVGGMCPGGLGGGAPQKNLKTSKIGRFGGSKGAETNALGEWGRFLKFQLDSVWI